jgi:CRISPR-associated endonuclease/helicase Cas3
MKEFVRRVCRPYSPSRLIHSNSWLMDELPGLSPVATGSSLVSEDARAGRDWFASTKRALIAPFGVGTVDQALLGIVAAKHFLFDILPLLEK